jgi:hypothetical protein
LGNYLDGSIQADYELKTYTSLNISSELYNFSVNNLSENTVMDLIVERGSSKINWAEGQLDLHLNNPLNLMKAVVLTRRVGLCKSTKVSD